VSTTPAQYATAAICPSGPDSYFVANTKIPIKIAQSIDPQQVAYLDADRSSSRKAEKLI
jgi:hypothetical protein